MTILFVRKKKTLFNNFISSVSASLHFGKYPLDANCVRSSVSVAPQECAVFIQSENKCRRRIREVRRYKKYQTNISTGNKNLVSKNILIIDDYIYNAI